MSELPKLTVKQKRFLKYYLQDPGNATEAARKAGYSPKSCSEIACRLLKKSQLLPYLQLALEDGDLDIDIDSEDIINQLKGMSETNIFDLVGVEQGRAVIIKNLEDIPYEYGQYIQSIKETSHGIELKFYEKTKCLDMLAKLKGMYKEDNSQKAAIAINIDSAEEKI